MDNSTMAAFTGEQIAAADALIKRAENVLGPLETGQRRDLLLDNFDWLTSARDLLLAVESRRAMPSIFRDQEPEA